MNSSCSSCEVEENCPDSVDKKLSKELYAKNFVNNILTNGSLTTCDETTDCLNNEDLPLFYDEEMFKRGQEFFYQHIFAMCLGSFLGLLADLTNQAGLAVLIMTKMSSSNAAAYKRYMATIFHMMVWYDSDFKPGSKLWASLKQVRCKHKCASKMAYTRMNYRFTQKDMALAHWGFMGVAVSRPEFVGIYDKNEENWKCFVHLWRVIGYLLGITDQYNICRNSLEETRAICNEIALQVFRPEVSKQEAHYMQMCGFLIEGISAINPFLEIKSFMFYLEATLIEDATRISSQNQQYKELTWGQRARLQIILFLTGMMKYSVVRVLLDYLQLHAFWVAKNYNYLAHWKFGHEYAHGKNLWGGFKQSQT